MCTGIGTGIRYFFQTDIAPRLLEKGIRVIGVVPNPEEVFQAESERLPGFQAVALKATNGSRDGRLTALTNSVGGYLRSTGLSAKTNGAVVQFYRDCAALRFRGPIKRPVFAALEAATVVLQRSHTARRLLASRLSRPPKHHLHANLFEQHRPNLVVVSSPGWYPGDAELILEARARGIPSVAVVVGWDHTSSQGLAAPLPDRICVWSDVQKQELIRGSDVDPGIVDVLGVAHFDYYRRRNFGLSRADFFAKFGLDESRRLVSFACSFVNHSSNIGVVKLLAEAVARDGLCAPAQLLIRLHPSYFKKPGEVVPEVNEEAKAIAEIARTNPRVHLDSPLLNSKELSMATDREDIVNLAGVLRHSDVFTTLFSTMVLEAAVNDMPTVCAAMPPPPEWQRERWLSIGSALTWPTHQRILASRAARVGFTDREFLDAVDGYLRDPSLDRDQRRQLAVEETTYLDDHAGQRIADYLLGIAGASPSNATTPS